MTEFWFQITNIVLREMRWEGWVRMRVTRVKHKEAAGSHLFETYNTHLFGDTHIKHALIIC